VQRLDDQLDADEPEYDGQADAEVHQPVEQPADEEVEPPKSHQREHVRGEELGINRPLQPIVVGCRPGGAECQGDD